MPGVLFKIPLTLWVRETIDKMNKNGKSDIQSWGNYWYKTYKELGGQSKESGTKGCPQHAAYGLWRLGCIKNTNIPYQQIPLDAIEQRFGKNATYAVIALDLIKKGPDAQSTAALWEKVQSVYIRSVHGQPANSEQGAVRIALVLFQEGQIVKG